MAVLGPPPEFGSSGSWPPISSVPVEVARWYLDQTVGEYIDPRLSRITRARDRLIDMYPIIRTIPPSKRKEWEWELESPLKERVAKAKDRIRSLAHGDSDIDPFDALFWKTQAVYEQYWERDDPPTQLAPGGSDERSVSLRVGLTEERAREVTKSLGLSGRKANLSLSGQLTSKTATKITVAREQVVTRKITLTNPTNERYRLIAMWHLVSRLSVIAMSFQNEGSNLLLQSTDFILSDSVVQTSIDVSRRRK